MKNYLITLFLIVPFLFSACNKKGEESSNLVTRRIQYDVTIKSPDPDYDWWVQNIEGEKREGFIGKIIGAATEGRVKAYDFVSDRLLTPAEVNQMLHRADTVAMERPDPPNELFDTVIRQDVQLKNITRVRFLEEWSMDEKTLLFSKKVLGICPLLEDYSETGEMRGYRPLFWVFFDDQYPGKLK